MALITNIPEVAEENPGSTFIAPEVSNTPAIQEPLSSQLTTFRGIRERMEQDMLAITQETDPNKKILALTEFQARIGEHLDRVGQDISNAARQRSGLGFYEDMLRQSEAADRAHPNFALYKTDSNETQHLRRQVESARKVYTELGKEMVGSNFELKGIVKRADAFVKMQEGQLDFDRRRSLIKDEKQAEKEAKTSEVASQVEPQARLWLAKLDPSLAADAKRMDSTIVSQLSGPNKKEYAQVYELGTSEQDLVRMGAFGNRFALSIVAKLQAEKTMKPESVTQEEVRNLAIATTSADHFARYISASNDPLLKSEAREYLAKAKIAKDDKNTQEALAKTRYDLMSSHLSRRAKATFESNIDTWKDQSGLNVYARDPGVLATVERLKAANNGRPVSLQEVTDEFVNTGETRKGQAERLDIIKKMYQDVLRTHNQGLYGKINEASAINQVAARFALSNVFKSRGGDTTVVSPYPWLNIEVQ